MKKRLFSILALLLVVATCLPLSVSAAEKIAITSAASDIPAVADKARAECSVDSLRSGVDGGLWYMGDCSQKAAGDSIASDGERYLTYGLSQTANISSVKIQWFQGGSSVTDVKADKNRVYEFWIEASANGTDFTKIYPESATSNGKSGTGADAEEYTCKAFTGAKYIRIHGLGSSGDATASNNKFFAIRNVEVYGTGTGGAGGDVGSDSTKAPSSSGSGSSSGGSSTPNTGDFENILIIAGLAILSGAAVLVIRKKIRER